MSFCSFFFFQSRKLLPACVFVRGILGFAKFQAAFCAGQLDFGNCGSLLRGQMHILAFFSSPDLKCNHLILFFLFLNFNCAPRIMLPCFLLIGLFCSSRIFQGKQFPLFFCLLFCCQQSLQSFLLESIFPCQCFALQ